MKSKKGSAKICGLLFMASLLANLVMGLMLSGCETLGLTKKGHDEVSLTQLKEVAKRLDVEVPQNAEAVDVATGIQNALNKAVVKVPERFSDKATRAVLLVLDENDKNRFLQQKAFLESLQGKRVLVIPQKRMIPSAELSESVK